MPWSEDFCCLRILRRNMKYLAESELCPVSVRRRVGELRDSTDLLGARGLGCVHRDNARAFGPCMHGFSMVPALPGPASPSDQEDVKGIAVTGYISQGSIREQVRECRLVDGSGRSPTEGPYWAWWLPVLRDSQLGDARWADGVLAWRLERDSGAPARAREQSAAAVWEWNLFSVRSDMELVVSELVTNALRHGTPPEDGGVPDVGVGNTIHVSLMRCDSEVVCAVGDGNDRPPVPRKPDFLRETGRGLNLVASFSRSWGTLPIPTGGKYVWALLM